MGFLEMYNSDLTDKEWEEIEPFLTYENGYGNRRKHSARYIVNAILYLVTSGCSWRLLPKCFANWKTVYTYYRRLCIRGTWSQILEALVKKKESCKDVQKIQVVESLILKLLKLPTMDQSEDLMEIKKLKVEKGNS
jgi:transposase